MLMKTYSEVLSLGDTLQFVKGFVKIFFESLFLQESLEKVASFSRDLYQVISFVGSPKFFYKKVINESYLILDKIQFLSFKVFVVMFPLKSYVIKRVSSLRTEILNFIPALEKIIGLSKILLEELILVDFISKTSAFIFKAYENLNLKPFFEKVTLIQRKFVEVFSLIESPRKNILKTTFELWKGKDLLKEKASKEIEEFLHFVFILRRKFGFTKEEFLTLKDALVKKTSRICLTTLIISSIIKSSKTQFKVLSAKLNLFDLLSQKITAIEINLQETLLLVSFLSTLVSKKLKETTNVISQILRISTPLIREFTVKILLGAQYARTLKKKFWAKIKGVLKSENS